MVHRALFNTLSKISLPAKINIFKASLNWSAWSSRQLRAILISLAVIKMNSFPPICGCVIFLSMFTQTPVPLRILSHTLLLTPAHCRSLPHTAAHCRSLPLTAAHCRSLSQMLMHEYQRENGKSPICYHKHQDQTKTFVLTYGSSEWLLVSNAPSTLEWSITQNPCFLVVK